jgi:hypothetical protein
MENEVLKDIKTEITAIRKVINSDFEGVGHAEDRIALDLRLQQLSHTLIKVNSSLVDLKILLVILGVVMFLK